MISNRFATPDTLGPKVANQVFVTRHMALKAPELLDEGVCYLSSFAPSVMGLTGIETAEVIRGVADNVKPDCIIAIDALAARSATRTIRRFRLQTRFSPGRSRQAARNLMLLLMQSILRRCTYCSRYSDFSFDALNDLFRIC